MHLQSFFAFLAICLWVSDVFGAGATLSGSPEFQSMMARFLSTYRPIIRAERDLRLEIRVIRQEDEEESGESAEYFGGAAVDGDRFVISIGDQTPQVSHLTSEGLLFLLCHETGHLLGGEPKKTGSDGQPSWASGEAESDYYAARDCMPRLLGNGRADEIIRTGLGFFQALHRFVGAPAAVEPKLESRDTSVAPRTITGYVSFQCRLDTLVAGASGGDRPACWFRP